MRLCRKEEAQAAVAQRRPKTSRRVRQRNSLWHYWLQQRTTGESTLPADMPFRIWCRECGIGRGRMHQHRAGEREREREKSQYGYLIDRDDQLQETTGAPILSRIGAAIVPTNGANEYAIAELKNDVSGRGFPEVLVRSDNAVLSLTDSTVTALKLAAVTAKAGECQVQGLPRGCASCVARCEFACCYGRGGCAWKEHGLSE